MLTYGGTEVQGVTYNGQAVGVVTYNGTTVWAAAKDVSLSVTAAYTSGDLGNYGHLKIEVPSIPNVDGAKIHYFLGNAELNHERIYRPRFSSWDTVCELYFDNNNYYAYTSPAALYIDWTPSQIQIYAENNTVLTKSYSGTHILQVTYEKCSNVPVTITGKVSDYPLT